MTTKTIAATATAALLLAAGSAEADILHYQAVLKGANETPNASHGRGELTGTLDTDRRVLDYTVTYSGLSGPATAASFHDRSGAAAQDVAAQAPAKGAELHATVQLTKAQIEELNAGRWSFTLGTKANPGGEVSGELQRSGGEY